MRKLLIIKSILLLLVSLFSMNAFSADPKIHGWGTTGNIVINSTDWQKVYSTADPAANGGSDKSLFVTGGGVNDCLITASAVLISPSARDAEYLFTIKKRSASVSTSETAVRAIEFTQGSGDDPRVISVSTHISYQDLSASNGIGGSNRHIFELVAKRARADVPAVTVSAVRVDYVCI